MGKDEHIINESVDVKKKKIRQTARSKSGSTKLALFGGTAVRTDPFPSWPIFKDREEQLLTKALKSGDWSFNGPMEVKFAELFTKFHNASYGFCVVNGSISLEIAMKIAGIGLGDEVIVPPLTWMGTAAAVLFCGAIPVFVDVEPDTYCLDPDLIEEAITSHTKAIIPVHLFGNMADMDRILDIAAKRKLIVIEDCAHTHGSQWRGKGAGSIGDFGSFSFQQSKLLTSGEGGFIMTNSEEYEDKIYAYKHVGYHQKGKMWRFFYEGDYIKGLLRGAYIKNSGKGFIGHNYRFNEFQAAVLLAQLERLPEQINKREENAAILSNGLSEISGVRPMRRDKRVTRQSYYQFVFRCNADEFQGIQSSVIRDALRAEGIPCGIVYDPVYRCPLFNADPDEYPFKFTEYGKKIYYDQLFLKVAEIAATNEAITIPHEVLLSTNKDMEDIIEAVAKVRGECVHLHKYSN
jgi:L-glutamine:2-deoxy-scyllo-inosose/3-amino-2,3-dideoxy-scyllo-inosose aminotransferase